jgi:hypothetical protein
MRPKSAVTSGKIRIFSMTAADLATYRPFTAFVQCKNIRLQLRQLALFEA